MRGFLVYIIFIWMYTIMINKMKVLINIIYVVALLSIETAVWVDVNNFI